MQQQATHLLEKSTSEMTPSNPSPERMTRATCPKMSNKLPSSIGTSSSIRIIHHTSISNFTLPSRRGRLQSYPNLSKIIEPCGISSMGIVFEEPSFSGCSNLWQLPGYMSATILLNQRFSTETPHRRIVNMIIGTYTAALINTGLILTKRLVTAKSSFRGGANLQYQRRAAA